MSKSTQEITKLEGDELVVKSKVMEGEIISKPSKSCITTLINTEKGQELVVKVANMDGGSGGGGGSTVVVDQTYDPTSTNAQSGTAVAEAVTAAVAPALKNKATGTGSIQISATSNTSISQIYVTAIGNVAAVGTSGIGISSGNTSCTVSTAAIAIGNAMATGIGSIAIAPNSLGSATALDSIQLGAGSNSKAKTLQVFAFQLLDGTTGLIPADRLGTGFDATKTQFLKNVNGTLTWVDEA